MHMPFFKQSKDIPETLQHFQRGSKGLLTHCSQNLVQGSFGKTHVLQTLIEVVAERETLPWSWKSAATCGFFRIDGAWLPKERGPADP